MTGIWVAADTISATRMNEKTIFIGTGAAISGLATTYPGMLAFCTSTGSGFSKNREYIRNTANTDWINIYENIPAMPSDSTIGNYTQSNSGYDEGKEAGITITKGFTGGGWVDNPSLTKALDGDNSTKTDGVVHDTNNAWMQFDFGSDATRVFSIKWSYRNKAGSVAFTARLQYSDDASTWTNQFEITGYTSTTEVIRTDTFSANARYIRVFVVGEALNAQQTFGIYQLYTAPTLSDNDTTTVHTTIAATNPSVDVALSASGIICAVAVYWDSASTETEIAIRISTDHTFTSGENVRVITVSNLTSAAWNYINFNPVTGQYIQIYGNSGASKIISIAEIKALIKTESQIIVGHIQKTISTSSTGIELDGF